MPRTPRRTKAQIAEAEAEWVERFALEQRLLPWWLENVLPPVARGLTKSHGLYSDIPILADRAASMDGSLRKLRERTFTKPLPPPDGDIEAQQLAVRALQNGTYAALEAAIRFSEGLCVPWVGGLQRALFEPFAPYSHTYLDPPLATVVTLTAEGMRWEVAVVAATAALSD